MAMRTIQTVAGRIAVPRGRMLMHEHTVIGWLGHHLDTRARTDPDVEVFAAVEVFTDLREHCGIELMVDAAPADLGRDVGVQVRIAAATGIHIVASTGFDKDGRGLPFYFQRLSDDELEDFLTHELERGVADTEIRCGVIKLGSTGADLSAHELRTFRAGGRVSRRLDRPIITHTDPDGWDEGMVGLRQLEVLLGAGARPERVAIGHACGARNVAPLVEICRAGAFVAIDRVGLERVRPDAHRSRLVLQLIEAGFADQVLISQDAQAIWRDPHPQPMRSFRRIHDDFLPALISLGMPTALGEVLLHDNPARLLATDA
jgi:phosphotriesterase-related protein